MTETVDLELPEPHFALFETVRAGQPIVVVLNDALLDFTHPEIFPWGLHIVLQPNEITEDGMPTADESDVLFGIADQLEAEVASVLTEFGSDNALFVARVTGNGRRELIYQVHDAQRLDDKLKSLVEQVDWPRSWSYELARDPRWPLCAALFQLRAGAKNQVS
jgi:hypothetical protein